MRKLLAVVGAVAFSIFALAGPARAGTDTGYDYTGDHVASSEGPDADYSGIGSTTLDATEFNGATWGRSARPGAPGVCTGGSSGDEVTNGCRWWYPDFRVNCLPSSSSDAAFEVLYVYNDRKADADTWLRQPGNLGPVKTLLAGVSSIDSATSEMDLIDSGSVSTRKGYDREPRWVTNSGTSGACKPNITDVAVPSSVLRRPPAQVNAYGSYAPGLWAWLNDQGYDQANRDHVLIVDSTGDTVSQNHCNPNSGLTPGAISTGPALPAAQWGPYGTGQNSDVAEDPGASPDDQMPNWGGGFAEICVDANYMNHAIDFDHWRSGDFVHGVAHEMGHVLGVDPDAPGANSSNHLNSVVSIMGSNNGDYCGNSVMSFYRYDCNNDQVWANEGTHSQAAWAYDVYLQGDTLVHQTGRWAMSQNAYLWGTPKPTTYTHWDIRLTGIDYCQNGPASYCVD